MIKLWNNLKPWKKGVIIFLIIVILLLVPLYQKNYFRHTKRVNGEKYYIIKQRPDISHTSSIGMRVLSLNKLEEGVEFDRNYNASLEEGYKINLEFINFEDERQYCSYWIQESFSVLTDKGEYFPIIFCGVCQYVGDGPAGFPKYECRNPPDCIMFEYMKNNEVKQRTWYVNVNKNSTPEFLIRNNGPFESVDKIKLPDIDI